MECSVSLGKYTLISLVRCLYKLLAKVLPSRLGRVIDALVAQNQSAFIKDRHLEDGVAVVNEVVDYTKKTSKECMIIQVNFEKAIDSVDWGFLDYMLGRFGFCDEWRSWIRACFLGEASSIG